jgi:hypothetical protein
MDLGKARTIGPHLYQIGLEETLHWEGRYKDMPTPAVCTVCNNKDLPYQWQAQAHCESREHRERCAKRGEEMITKARETLAAKDKSGRSIQPPSSRTSKPNTFKSPPPFVDFPCAGSRCRGRVSVPAGNPRAEGQCTICKFTQVVPANRGKE